ncbi:DNA/RNA-binding protein [Renibacterium salmoninarum ATCC 33209]|uniref:DNA/RNA-binding protein n=1 Tax=Renibacterium salmoninarum (strain ATCC 33209 / DSM 20767 / JCM 11484 / NBRC 15589 / NCIMB 2235) TaxID=288705 RepID=A9WR28_RENSM|nr:YlxR family protein [Renibacterium salmoninarum]ABY22402.1 DNA/RNA-binding protein [Renibacterium salmoninarum ATCC 33209]
MSTTQLTASKTPIRTCVGCRCRDAQPKLLRVVRDASGVLEVDPHRSMAGRGAWLHPEKACLDLALKRHGFSRAFRGAGETASVESYFAQNRTVQPESGSEN